MPDYPEYANRSEGTYTAFVNQIKVYQGSFAGAPEAIRCSLEANGLVSEIYHQQILVFDDGTGKLVDVDIRQCSIDTALNNMQNAEEAADRRKVGRPKLGVTSREVSLLPRHWEWLERGRGGASATLRRLIDEARRADPEGERRQQATEAAGRFMTVMAGDLPGYEEASRALYAGDTARLRTLTAAWPEDVQTHLLYLLSPPFGSQA